MDAQRLRSAWERHRLNSGHGQEGHVECSPRCSQAIANQYDRNYAADPEEWDDEEAQA